jgi:alkaline phosphatase
LLDGIEGTVFTLGDHAYLEGTADEFRRCYETTGGATKLARAPRQATTTT